jgi:hypothetical protein
MSTCLLNLLPYSWISYLVSGSFEQAVSSTLSASDRMHQAALENLCDHAELLEMLESAGMVLVQALKELKRLVFSVPSSYYSITFCLNQNFSFRHVL